jgi:DHA2 family multidrug resistance protein
MSVAQAILLRNYPVHLRGLALGLWAMVVIVAPIVGPVLGGWITDNFSWPWLFFINVPVGLGAAGISWWLLRHRESMRVKVPVDAVGPALLASAWRFCSSCSTTATRRTGSIPMKS